MNMNSSGARWMTADEWETSDDVSRMLHNAEKLRDARKFSLFAVGCCRRHASMLPPESAALLTEFEVLLDQLTRPSPAEVNAAGKDLCWRANAVVATMESAGVVRNDPRIIVAKATCYAVIGCPWGSHSYFVERGPQEKRPLADLLRDIVGNPFRPFNCDAAWRTEAVRSLAQAMYDLRDFSAMPLLAEALESAGCRDATLLGHCRQSLPHFRGCWVVEVLRSRRAGNDIPAPPSP